MHRISLLTTDSRSWAGPARYYLNRYHVRLLRQEEGDSTRCHLRLVSGKTAAAGRGPSPTEDNDVDVVHAIYGPGPLTPLPLSFSF